MKNTIVIIPLVISLAFSGCASFTPAPEFIDVTIHRFQNIAISNGKTSISSIYGPDKMVIVFNQNDTDQTRTVVLQQLKSFCSQKGILLEERTYNSIKEYKPKNYSIAYIENGDFYVFPDSYADIIVFTKSGFISPMQIIQAEAEGTHLKIVSE